MDSRMPPVAPIRESPRDLQSLRIPEGKRTPVRERRPWLFVAIVLVVILASAWPAVHFLSSAKPVVETFTVAEAGARDDQLASLNASGYVTPRRRATIASKTTGRLADVYVDEGAVVKLGEILARLDDSDLRQSLAVAQQDRDTSIASIKDYEVQLRQAALVLSRTQQLMAARVAPQQDLDSAKAAADSLNAKIAIAKQQVQAGDARVAEAAQALADTIIYAPFSGVVVSRDAQVGEIVSPVSAGGGFTRTGIATLVDMNSLEIEVDVNETYIARVSLNQPVTATLDAYPDVRFPGRVRTIIPTADRQKGTIKVRISLLSPDSRILPDMGVKVGFLEQSPNRDAGRPSSAAHIVVPSGAVHHDGGIDSVFLVNDGRAERRAVTLAGIAGDQAEVHAGLAPGDIVIVRSSGPIHDGQQIAVKR